MTAANNQPSITTREAAVALQVDQKTVERWMRSGVLRAVKIGSRYRTTDEWIEQFVRPVESSGSQDRPAESKGCNRESASVASAAAVGRPDGWDAGEDLNTPSDYDLRT